MAPRTTLVAVSAVQSADGRVIDLDALHTATEATGTKVLLDTTQAVGWLPVDAPRFAYTACGGYKWLLSPRGTAYFTIHPELIDDLTPPARSAGPGSAGGRSARRPRTPATRSRSPLPTTRVLRTEPG